MSSDHPSEEWIDPGEAGCRLLVRVTSDNAAALTQARHHPSIAGFLLPPDLPRLEAWVEHAHNRHAAALIEGNAATAQAVIADGVTLADPRHVEPARTRLGGRALIGIVAQASRHDLMVVGETDADFVIIDDAGTEALVDLVAWWHEVAVLPIAVSTAADVQAIRSLRAVGVDFLILDRLEDAALAALDDA